MLSVPLHVLHKVLDGGELGLADLAGDVLGGDLAVGLPVMGVYLGFLLEEAGFFEVVVPVLEGPGEFLVLGEFEFYGAHFVEVVDHSD